MRYVLDTGFFVHCRVYYPSVFPHFWEKMEDAVTNGTISSVKEVRNEIERYGGSQDELLDWIKTHKTIFSEPSPGEQDRVREILAVPNFQTLVSKKNTYTGHPVADPFVIAKAWSIGGTVVTNEVSGSAKTTPKIKIPDVCSHFSVPCINPEKFMAQEKWRF